jgi:hypothetical protein
VRRPEKEALKEIALSLMLSENMGDVHDVLNTLHVFLGLPRPEGNYLQGWSEEDMARLEEPT